jgi:hypothetical protein
MLSIRDAGGGMPTAFEEKDAIREVLAEYCFRLDDGQFAEMAALFPKTVPGTPRSEEPPAGRRS